MAHDKTDKPVATRRATVSFRDAVKTAKGKLECYQENDPAIIIGSVWRLTGNPVVFINEAMETPKTFEEALSAVALALERNFELPPLIKDWLLQYLRGQVPKPNGKVGRNNSPYMLKVLMCECVQDLCDMGLKLGRNDTGESTSACDAVAEAMGELRLSPSTFEGVKRIYYTIKKDALEDALTDVVSDLS
jgi:hypothetical protein